MSRSVAHDQGNSWHFLTFNVSVIVVPNISSFSVGEAVPTHTFPLSLFNRLSPFHAIDELVVVVLSHLNISNEVLPLVFVHLKSLRLALSVAVSVNKFIIKNCTPATQ